MEAEDVRSSFLATTVHRQRGRVLLERNLQGGVLQQGPPHTTERHGGTIPPDRHCPETPFESGPVRHFP